MNGSNLDISPDVIKYITDFYDLEIPDLLPEPVGYNILVLPIVGRKKTKGGIIIPDTSEEAIRLHTISALVLKLGPEAFIDKSKFPSGPRCKVGDFIQIEKYRGLMFQVAYTKENGDKDTASLRLLDDDMVRSVLPTTDHVRSMQMGW